MNTTLVAPAEAPAPAAGAAPRRGRFPWLIAAAMLVMLTVIALTLVLQWLPSPLLTVDIDGEHIWSGHELAGLNGPEKVALAAVVLVALLVAAVVVPVVVLITALVVVAVILAAVALPVFVVALVLAALASPLLLLAGLVWLVVR